MKTFLLPLLFISPCMSADSLTYPKAPTADVKDVLHGITIQDPFRPLEEIDSAETRTWVEAQAALANGYLSKLPGRQKIVDRLKTLMDYDRLGLPSTEAGRVFFSRKTGLQNQGVLFWKEATPDAKEQVLLDPNLLSSDGTVALSGWDVSRDGKRLAYGISRSGSDWNEWRVRDIASGKDESDLLKWIKFNRPSWNRAGDALYYGRFEAPPEGQVLKQKNENQKVFLHRLGDAQEKDQLIYARPDHPQWGFSCGETDDGRFLLIHVSEGTAVENGLFYKDLKAGADAPVVELLKDFDADYNFVGNDGGTFYLLTTKDAPNKKLIALDIEKPAKEHWRTILPETKFPLSSVEYVGGKFIATRMVDAHDEVTVHDPAGKEIGKIEVPGLGIASGFRGHQSDTVTYYFVTNFTTPGEIYRYDTMTGKSTLTERSKVNFDPTLYEVQQVSDPWSKTSS